MNQTLDKPIRLDQAKTIADHITSLVESSCQRVQPVGALRRCEMSVWSIDLLVIPSVLHGKKDALFVEFAEPTEPVNRFLQRLDDLREQGVFSKRLDAQGRECWGGLKQRALFGAVPVNFYSVMDPAQWGYRLACLTGPDDYRRDLQTIKLKGGLLPNNLEVHSGYVWEYANKKPLETFEESDFFKLLGFNSVPDPQDRGRELAVAI